MSSRDREARLASVRELTRRYQSGDPDAPDAFRKLVDLLLRVTVLKEQGAVLKYRLEDENTFQVGGPNNTFAPLPLRNGKYPQVPGAAEDLATRWPQFPNESSFRALRRGCGRRRRTGCLAKVQI